MSMQTLDVQNLIIGFGKAGKTLAADLARHGQSVILAEASPHMYGGTCINVGCIPSKKLLTEGARRAPCVAADAMDAEAVFHAAMQAKDALIPKLRAANFAKLDQMAGVHVITARARFQDEHTVILEGEGQSCAVRAERIFINTGTLPVAPDIPGVNHPHIHDSTGALSLAQRPQRLLIVGGGYIGLEFAFMYRAFGSEVTVLEADATFLPREDRDIAGEMQRILQSRGIRLVTDAAVERFEPGDGQASAVTAVTSQGRFSADAVLLAVGRRPNTGGLALERAGIAVNERGFIQVDEQLRAKPHIWAMGDVAGSPQFTYISLDDWRIVRDQLLGDGQRRTSDRAPFPTAVFTEPPLAHIGLTETAARQSGRAITLHTLAAEAIPQAKVLGQTDGLLKAVTDASTGEILGVTLLCAQAHELINLFKMAIDHRIPARAIKNQIFTHPTMAEAFNDLFANA